MQFSFFYKISDRIIRKYQSLLGISTLGPRAIILNSKNQILLVKHTYQSHWHLPGGGLKKGESVKMALLRELKEEVGLIVIGEPQLFGLYHHIHLGVNDYPIIYIIKNYSLTHCNSPEIEEMGWFDYENLPPMTSPGTKRRLNEYFTNLPPADVW